MNGLDLFSGIGGLTIALHDWVKPIAYCEIDPYCQGVLLSRQYAELLPKAPIWDDITTLRIRTNGRNVDIFYGGFPCQDISIAGLGKGLAGERSGLFFEIVRLAKEIQPKFIFLENVPAITTRGGLQVVREIAEIGYDCRWCVISAASIGAPHKRERWFLLAYSSSLRCNERSGKRIHKKREAKQYEKSCNFGSPGNVPRMDEQILNEISYWKKIEPPICGVDDGISNRMDRIRALGNGVVAQQAKEAFKILMGIK